MDELVTNTIVAKRIGSSRETFVKFMGRHPELRPAIRLEPSGIMLWTEEEIQRLIEAKSKLKRGRPRKDKVEEVKQGVAPGGTSESFDGAA